MVTDMVIWPINLRKCYLEKSIRTTNKPRKQWCGNFRSSHILKVKKEKPNGATTNRDWLETIISICKKNPTVFHIEFRPPTHKKFIRLLSIVAFIFNCFTCKYVGDLLLALLAEDERSGESPIVLARRNWWIIILHYLFLSNLTIRLNQHVRHESWSILMEKLLTCSINDSLYTISHYSHSRSGADRFN